ncbi:uncharacterized protein LOC143028528 [Oratosquilla oratoria]|uniref:uncharacterized protein LOC143028528 n=1 Tax=Oratosquilla oratoria TaxID=337810 RepID=UPI003F77455A
MSWRVPLSKGKHITIISAYASTLAAVDCVKEQFYNSLNECLQAIHRTDRVLLMGDFNSDRKEFLVTKAMRGADCWTDHRLLRCKIRLEIRPQQRRALHTKKLNITSLGDPEVCTQFRSNVAESYMQHDQGPDLGTKWAHLHSDLNKYAVDTRIQAKTPSRLGGDAGISIQHRLDGSLFNTRRLHARTKVSSTQVIELQYADNYAIVVHDAEDLQNILDVFSSTYAAMGLRVNTLKREILVQTVHPPKTHHLFLVNGEPVKTIEHFTYLGIVVHSDCSVDLDIQRRINLAFTAFGRLRGRVFSNNNLRIDTEASVYKAVCISTLLYGSEIWTMYRRQIRILENIHTRCLQRKLGLS